MTVWLRFSFGELLRPVTFSDKYFFITFFISCIQCWLVEGCLSPADFHPSLVPQLDLAMCCVEGKEFLEVKTGTIYVLLMQKCWSYNVILHSALIVFWILHISNFIWKATVVKRISLSKAILHYILWCNSNQCSQSFGDEFLNSVCYCWTISYQLSFSRNIVTFLSSFRRFFLAYEVFGVKFCTQKIWVLCSCAWTVVYHS